MSIKYVIFLCCLQLAHSHQANTDEPRAELQDVAADDSSASSSEPAEDLIGDHMSWACANNASCVQDIADEVLARLREHRPLSLAGIQVDPLDTGVQVDEARGTSLVDLLSQNSVKIPLGPMVVSVQRSSDYSDYIEVALLRKGEETARRGGAFGGGLGGNKDRKHLQIYIPLFLAFNAVGWMVLAIKSVGVLTLKALIVSKLALIVTTIVIVKRMMDRATESYLQSHHYDHPEPMMMPYNMDYAMPSHQFHAAQEMGAQDLYSLHMAANGHNAGGAGDAQGHGDGGLGAESQLSQVVNLASVQSQQQQQQQMIQQQQQQLQQQGLVGLAGVPKVKRQDRDMWAGFRKRPLFYNFLSGRAPGAALY